METDPKKRVSKKCPFCAEEINDEAIVCKHCGKDLDKRKVKSKQYQWTPGKIGCAVFLGIMFLIIVIAASSTPKSNQSTGSTSSSTVATQNNDMQIGDDGYLRLPGITDTKQVICLGNTKDDANQISKALAAKDFVGILEIPGAFCVGNGSQAKLIDKDFPLRRVRITKGINDVDSDKVGLSGWLPYEWVVKN